MIRYLPDFCLFNLLKGTRLSLSKWKKWTLLWPTTVICYLLTWVSMERVYLII
jgi:hypothetical protein